ncbi:Type I Iterative PKS [Myotisia sp. PD_48]|nr:Type I Iterative PKS [Myotisia sp. PD_48]
MSVDIPDLVVCGPQTSLPASDDLARLRDFLIHDHGIQDLTRAIVDLPSLWLSLVSIQPRLNQVPGMQLLQQFKEWITNDDYTFQIPETLPNTQLAALTIIIHVVDYFSFLNSLHSNDAHTRILEKVRTSGGIQGLCTGLITAIALASSRNKAEICKNAAVAMRLAVTTGAWIDLDRAGEQTLERFICISTSWTSENGEQTLMSVLAKYPKAYISVRMDITCATITAPENCISFLSDDLVDGGIRVNRLDVYGRFHHPAHEKAVKELSQLCESVPSLQFHQYRPLVPVRRNDNACVIADQPLHEIILHCLLEAKAEWHLTITASITSIVDDDSCSPGLILVLGLVNCIPHSVTAKNTSHILHYHPNLPQVDEKQYTCPEDSIAIIGAACRFPGANSLAEYWDVIRSGATLAQDIPENRMRKDHLTRRGDSERLSYFGNFISDVDGFDHSFFKRSPREARSMDPQQRIALQLAYEALESAGYLSHTLMGAEIGCYVGVAASDYECNVNSHAPTAFSFTGTARAFISGAVSHFFGWTGPSIVIDTACSSSLVAIHMACKAIQSGECTIAMAGGVNVITSPNFHQNLAAASFLSPSGACRPFDENADGYCRGEGGGFVLLKKLSSAIADGDNIHAIIAGSAMNQNDKSFPPTAPVSRSQVKVYERALSVAKMHPSIISYVEAHGTGTTIGDPIECQSIKHVFGGNQNKSLDLGSVKGCIGHAEAASGVAGLIKVLLMIQNSEIPPQANFKALNPSIRPLENRNLAINTTLKKWDSKFRAACVNNYGAAGNNAALVVCQSPEHPKDSVDLSSTTSATRYPFLLAANSGESLRRYCFALTHYVESQNDTRGGISMSDLAYNVSRILNPELCRQRAFTAQSTSEMLNILKQISSESTDSHPFKPLKPKAVILIFGGQSRNTIHFSEEAYRSSSLMQSHLQQCDRTLKSMGLKSIFPRIFSSEPVFDLVNLHCMLFSLQYASAMSWINAGLKVDALVGHSFGQLTALCVSGAITLSDALKLISGRAILIEKRWNQNRGYLLNVDGDIQTVQEMIASIPDETIEIACYNTPTNHTLAGTETAIEKFESMVVSKQTSPSVNVRRLNVSHGFHSMLADCIMPEYRELLQSITYGKPTIPIEDCSNHPCWDEITPQLVAQHSREPVYFYDAIARIERRLGSCAWVEAGSGSTTVNMACRALGPINHLLHSFHSVKFNGPNPMTSLAETTVRLWQEGIRVRFWLFLQPQKSCFRFLNLPPYQFENSPHWLPYVEERQPTHLTEDRRLEMNDPQLVSLKRYLQSDRQVAEFAINQRTEEYNAIAQSRRVLGNTLGSAPLYIEAALQAVSLLAETSSSQYIRAASVKKLKIHSPLNSNPDLTVRLILTQKTRSSWDFVVNSIISEVASTINQHASGKICLPDVELFEHSPLQRLIRPESIRALRNEPGASTIQGKFIYKVFGNVVEYKSHPCFIKSITFNGSAALGNVTIPNAVSTSKSRFIYNPLVLGSFIQVAEMHANSVEECNEDEIFRASALDEATIYAGIGEPGSEMGPWTVYSKCNRIDYKECVGDLLVFNTQNDMLDMVIFGMRFFKGFASPKAFNCANGIVSAVVDTRETPRINPDFPLPSEQDTTSQHARKICAVKSTMRRMLHDITGAVMDGLSDNRSLIQLGVDSLNALELQKTINETLQVDISLHRCQNDMSFANLFQEVYSQIDAQNTPESTLSHFC